MNQLLTTWFLKSKQKLNGNCRWRFDSNAVNEKLGTAFPNADVVIPPVSGAVCLETNQALRNRKVLEIKEFGRMSWQRERRYGKPNNTELGIQRYKRILGNKMHARELSRQKK